MKIATRNRHATSGALFQARLPLESERQGAVQGQARKPAFGERFLEFPSRPLDRRRGVPWGTAEIEIDLSGGPYRFAGLGRRQRGSLEERFGELIVGPGQRREPLVEAAVFRVPASHFRSFESYNWNYTFDFDYQPSSVRVAGFRVMAELEWVGAGEASRAQATDRAEPRLRASLWTSTADGDEFQLVFENFLRLIVAYRLLACGGVLLHSAAVLDRGGAVVFFGHSGAGKSTISRLSLATGRTVLSDDLNALSDGEQGTLVEKVPFAGELGQNGSYGGHYPLRGLYRLEKGAQHLTRKLSRARLIASLIACSPYVNRDPFRLERLISNLGRLIDRVPARCLQFTPDPGFWNALREETPAT